MYSRLANVPIQEVLDQVIMQSRRSLVKTFKKDYKSHVVRFFHGVPVKMDSLRYQLFKTKGVKCIGCGLEGLYFGLDGTIEGTYHFNLYGIRYNREVMLTKDHIIPKSKGGRDWIDNMAPLCERCNALKADKLPEGEDYGK